MVQNEERETDTYDDEGPRSIFSALWFRALVVILVLGVVAVVAVPYVLDTVSTPDAKQTAAVKPPPTASTPATSPPPATAVATPPPSTTPAPPSTTTAAPPPTTVAPAASSAPAAPPGTPSGTALAPSPPSDRPAEPAKSEAPPVAARTEAARAEPARAEPRAAKPDTPKVDAGKPETARAETAQAEATKTEAAKPPRPAKTTVAARATKDPAAPKAATPKPETTASAPPADGAWWVQVGAFKDPETARRLADTLRGQNFSVEESVRSGAAQTATAAAATVTSTEPAAPADRYDVFVSGMAPAELSAKLRARGLAADPVAGGVVVKPSLPLREAVALSKDLAGEGLKVQVRRSGQSPASGTASAKEPAASTATLHRVRVGGFPDRAAAEAAARDLEARGFKGFIARGTK